MHDPAAVRSGTTTGVAKPEEASTMSSSSWDFLPTRNGLKSRLIDCRGAVSEGDA
jgi:hypothetical protein